MKRLRVIAPAPKNQNSAMKIQLLRIVATFPASARPENLCDNDPYPLATLDMDACKTITEGTGATGMLEALEKRMQEK